jgi:hypothetical protein
MMADPQRKPQNKNDQLTTADLAGRGETTPEDRVPETESSEWAGRPTLVRKEEVRKEDERVDAASQNRTSTASTRELTATPLFSEAEVKELRDGWSNVQSAFVDEPRKAVEEADKLVANVMRRLAEGFASERSNLENQWARGGDVSTEDLRLALQRYRSFFDRLLHA